MKYDVAVIGGGPAGMMAAGKAGESGARVVLLEKNHHLGLKILITGKGRCNITNGEDEPREMIKKFGLQGKFLFSSLFSFGADEAVEFFESLGVKTKVERGGRVFPESDLAKDVLNALIAYMKKNKVIVKTDTGVKDIIVKNGKIEKLLLLGGGEMVADKYILATGGKSYPLTGSTGDGYKWAQKMGHKVILPSPALVPVIVKDNIVSELEGLSLKNVEISAYQKGKKFDSRFGEAIFTANGLSGPIILDMSKSIGAKLVTGEVVLKIDFKPALDFVELDKRIQRDFIEMRNKVFKNSLDLLLPKKMISAVIKKSLINPEKKVSVISAEERKKVLRLLKEFSFEVASLEGFNKAIITAGGVDTLEVDPKTRHW